MDLLRSSTRNKNRIFYIGMCLLPSVTELMLAEFLYFQYEDAEKPIYMYIMYINFCSAACGYE